MKLTITLGCFLFVATSNLAVAHEVETSSSCSRLLSYAARLADKVDSIDCEEFDGLIADVFEDCKIGAEEKSLLAVKQLFEVWEDKDCEDDDDFECSEEMECLEDLFGNDGIDCGDDEEHLDDAKECIDDLDTDCEYTDKIEDILDGDEDDICKAKDRDIALDNSDWHSTLSYNSRSYRQYPPYYRNPYLYGH